MKCLHLDPIFLSDERQIKIKLIQGNSVDNQSGIVQILEPHEGLINHEEFDSMDAKVICRMLELP